MADGATHSMHGGRGGRASRRERGVVRRVRMTCVCGVARVLRVSVVTGVSIRGVLLSRVGRRGRSTAIAVVRLFVVSMTVVERRRRERSTLVVVRVVLSRIGRMRSMMRGIATLSNVSVFGGGIHGTVRWAWKRASGHGLRASKVRPGRRLLSVGVGVHVAGGLSVVRIAFGGVRGVGVVSWHVVWVDRQSDCCGK